MRLFVWLLLSACLSCGCVCVFAQTRPSAIRGKILAENHFPAEAATLVLLRAGDSAVVKSVVSDRNGQYQFSNIPPHDYLLLVSKVGYTRAYSGPYKVEPGERIIINDITLQLSTRQLKEVSVVSKKDYIETRTNKTVLNIDQNILATGNSVFDILSLAPGVKVSNDVVLFKGGQKPLFAINGKPVTLTDEQLAGMLKSMQSNMVSQVELIDNPSAKYDAASSGGMINIILKKNKLLGSSLGIFESAAIGDRYRFNNGINYALHTQKVNLFGSYNFSGGKAPHTINSIRNISDNNQVSTFAVDYLATTETKLHSFNLGADYLLSAKQTVGFLVNGFTTPSTIEKWNTTNISTNGIADSSIRTRSVVDRHISNVNYNLNYSAGLGKAGKSVISANVDYATYSRRSNEQVESDFYSSAGQLNANPVLYRDSSPSKIQVRAERVDFTTTLSKTATLEMGIKNSQVNSDNKIDFTQKVNDAYQLIPALTDHFVYHEQINAGYINYNDSFNKTNLAIGLRGEQTVASALSVNSGKPTLSNYFDLFPTASIGGFINPNNEYSIAVARKITRPAYPDLNPFVAYVDQFYYTTGNPFLRPMYDNTFAFTNVYRKKYKMGLSMIITRDFYFTIFEQDDVTKVYRTTTANLGTRYQYRAELMNFPLDITSWWNANLYVKTSYERYIYA
jgi:iron complex outermembrane receptor protein